MPCVICGEGDATYRLAADDGGDAAAAVCEQCATEHLDADGDETCTFCGDAAAYDLVAVDRDVRGSTGVTSPEEGEGYDAVAEGVVCDDHLADLREKGGDESARPPDDAAGTGPDV